MRGRNEIGRVHKSGVESVNLLLVPSLLVQLRKMPLSEKIALITISHENFDGFLDVKKYIVHALL